MISFPELSDGSETQLILHSPLGSFAEKSAGSFFRHAPLFTGRHETVLAASQDRSPQPWHPAQQQLSQGSPAPTYFSLNTNLLQQKGFFLLPKKHLKQFSTVATFLKTEISPHTPLEALVFNDKANLWTLFGGIYSDKKRWHTPSPFAALSEVAHSRKSQQIAAEHNNNRHFSSHMAPQKQKTHMHLNHHRAPLPWQRWPPPAHPHHALGLKY